MAIDFANLAVFWGALMDAVSGRTSTILAPPQTSNHWAPPTTPLTATTSSAGILTIVVRGPDGDIECTCPDPGGTIGSYHAINLNPLWRRCPVYSFDTWNTNVYYGFLTDIVQGARFELMGSVWPTLTYGHYGQSNIPVWGNLAVGFAFIIAPFEAIASPDAFVMSPAPWADTKYLDNSPNEAASSYGVVALYWSDGVVSGQATPADPDAQEALASLLQYPGQYTLGVPGPDIDALNNLATALAAGGGPGGTVKTHRSRQLLSLSPQSAELPRATGTSENMMHRVAAAVRLAFAGGVSLRTQRPNATVAVNKGIILKR